MVSRFVGIKNGNICIISDTMFNSNELQVLELPAELKSVSFGELVLSYKLKNGQFINKSAAKKVSEMKVAFVGNWKQRCGIATYSENLWPYIAKRVFDFKLFIEKNENKTSSAVQFGEDKIVECWKRGQPLQDLIDKIKAYDPDVIFIQHEYGLWPNAGYWLSMMSQLSEYRIIVTMHSIFRHKDKTICEAAIPEIVTHLQGGMDVLKNEKKIPGKVYVIPHGCDPCLDKNKLWNFYKSDRTFLQFGFGFRYKAFENSIKAAAILKQKYPDVFFTALFSESEGNMIEHRLYYNELMSLAKTLNVQENIAIIRGFQSDETLDSYIRTNQAAVFPYVSSEEHMVWGASGAARYSMSKAIPVITSSVNHFSDLPTIKADTPEEMANALELLFNNDENKKTQIEKQLKYIEENSWEKIAIRYCSLFES
jgi:glycosyltransferase involved in cell wall biosynthesis